MEKTKALNPKKAESSQGSRRREPLIDDSAKCMRHSARKWSAMVPHKVRVTLRDRILDESHLDKVRQCLQETADDFVIISAEGKILKSKLFLLQSCSGYFKGLARSQSSELRSRLIKLRVSLQTLRSVVDFITTGEISLTLSNVQQILLAADYLQIDCLKQAGCGFLESRLDEVFDICLHLANICDLPDLAETAMRKLCAAPETYRKTLIAFNGYALSDVICRDDFAVGAEDEVVDLVIAWSTFAVREPTEIEQVLGEIRYPHLTFRGLQRLVQSGLKKTNFQEQCERKLFSELPEEQLMRRSCYLGHMHVLWVESKKRVYSACVHHDPECTFSVTCVRNAGTKVVSNNLLETIEKSGWHYQILQVKNSLQFVSVSEDMSLMYLNRKLEGSSWAQDLIARKTEQVTLAAFSACVTGDQVFVNLRESEMWPHFIQVNALEASASTCTIGTTEALKESPFVVLRMAVHNEDIILMGRSVVEFYNMTTMQKTRLDSTTEYRGDGSDYITTFSEMVLVDDCLYVYEDVPSGDTRYRRHHRLFDRLHIISLASKELEEVVEMQVPLWTSLMLPGGDPGHLRKMFVHESKLIVAQQEITINHCKLVQFDLETRTFSELLDVPCADFAPETMQFRRFETGVPSHLHACDHESLLQAFYRVSTLANDEAALQWLARYLC